ncbi:MAG: CoA transferase [Dehalococcoidia bacterium]|nr:CoA transferase [Dehalococcoidia bacterium]
MGDGALAHLRVVDWGGRSAAYATRLLAEAGADVVRIVESDVDDLLETPPFLGQTRRSIPETWYNAGKRTARFDREAGADRERALDLIREADVLIEEWPAGSPALDPDELQTANDGLVRVGITPFGATGPWSTYASNDLVANALSGSASVTGNADTPPINGYGNQTHHTVGLYAAVCAMAGVRARRLSGRGCRIEVNAHEALASCTEQVLMQWFFPEGGPWRRPVAQRQGSLHWSGAYEVYPGKNGRGLMVSVALRLFDSLLPWLEEEGAAGELSNRDKYPTPATMVRDLPYLMQVMRGWVAERDPDELFYEGQRRHQPFGVVWDIATAVQSPQVAAREWIRDVTLPDGGGIPFPGPMVRLGEPPHPVPPAGEALADVPWRGRGDRLATERTTSEGPEPGRPLEGMRVLDFTHVLAGPFGTRVLGDLGAEIIKVGTSGRSGGANAPEHPYYASWNRNKRSITLDLGTARGLELARGLALRSDIVIDNFRAGVLAKWGLDRESLKQDNPGVSVITMGGMGQDGPWKDFVTFAPTIHALSGLTYLTNPPGRHDLGYGFSLTDHLSGLAAAYAACAAVEHRAQTGEGLAIDLAQYEVGLHILGPAYLNYLANGRNPQPVGNRHPEGTCAPHGIYRCAGEGSVGGHCRRNRRAMAGVLPRRQFRAAC